MEQGTESFLHERNRALHLLDRGFSVNARRMLQIGFRLGNDGRNRFQTFAQIRNPFFCRSKIARDQEVERVGQALIVNKRIPFPFLQLLELKNLVIDIVAQNLEIDAVGIVELTEVA